MFFYATISFGKWIYENAYKYFFNVICIHKLAAASFHLKHITQECFHMHPQESTYAKKNMIMKILFISKNESWRLIFSGSFFHCNSCPLSILQLKVKKYAIGSWWIIGRWYVCRLIIQKLFSFSFRIEL